MVKIERLSAYQPEIATRVRELLIQLSRSGKDKGEISPDWFTEVAQSPYHDLIFAVEDGQILGMASVSVTFGAGIHKNAYLEDFVVDSAARGKGVGDLIFQAYEDWAREKGCKNLEFTCGHGREVAQNFYKAHGAEIYDTNFFRKKL